ncbi:MAG: peroxiredoxin family protein [Hyphomonadaceae bacterium]
MKRFGFRRAVIAATLAMTGVGAVSQAAPALAEAPMEFGMKVGETVPAIEGTTQDGRPADFASLKGEHGMVLAFFRSADWCPFCKKQLEDLNTVAPQLAAAGYPLVALSYDPVETLKRFSEKKALTYTLLSDPDSKVIDAFGVRNEEVLGNKRFNGIPHPVIYVISDTGVIEARFFERNYRNRPPASSVLEAVSALNQ